MNLVGFMAVGQGSGRGFIEFCEPCVGNSRITLYWVFGGFDGSVLFGLSGSRLKRRSSFNGGSLDLGD